VEDTSRRLHDACVPDPPVPLGPAARGGRVKPSRAAGAIATCLVASGVVLAGRAPASGAAEADASAHREARPASPARALPSFPGAEGGGALSAGGRGGRAIEVTTLDDAGPGSLRACVEAVGPRTCIFRVSGVIEVSRTFDVQPANSYLTIAGQTAPGGGIALKTARPGPPDVKMFQVQGHDVIVRYLRIWGDANDGDDPAHGNGSYAFWVLAPASDVIVDHVSMLWQSGKAWNVYAYDGGVRPGAGGGGPGRGPTRTTLSWSIAGETLVPKATLVGGGGAGARWIEDADLHHDVLVSFSHRAPMWHVGTGRFVSNLVYNWGYFSAEFSAANDVVNNWWIPGPRTAALGATDRREVLLNESAGTPTVYFAGNRSDWTPGGRDPAAGAEPDGGWSKLTCANRAEQGACVRTPADPDWRRRSRLCAAGEDVGCSTAAHRTSIPGLPIAQSDAASTLKRVLLGDGGAGASRRLDCRGRWVLSRHPTDERIAWYVLHGGGPDGDAGPRAADAVARLNAMDTRGAVPRIAIDARGIPRVAAGAPCADLDHDGMPDEWEIARGLDPRDARDGAAVAPDGHTNLEHYLNGG
jgi:hypothetical protein